MLILMDKSIHEEHLSQPLQTNNKQFKIALTFLSVSNGIFNITNKNNKFYFSKSIIDDNRFQNITIPEGAYEIGSLDKEIKRIIISQGFFTSEDYPFLIKPKFSTLGSIIEISNEESAISFIPDDSIRDILGFDKTSIYEKYNSSPKPVDIISFDNIFIECDIAQGMIFQGKRTSNIHNLTMTVIPGYKYIEDFRGGILWYMMNTKDFVSSINFILKNENNDFVSFSGQNVNFGLSIKEV